MSPCVNLYFPTTPTFNLIILIFIMTTTTMMMMMMIILMMTTIWEGKFSLNVKYKTVLRSCIVPVAKYIFHPRSPNLWEQKTKIFLPVQYHSTNRHIVFHFLSSLPAIEKFSLLVISLSLQVYKYINNRALWIVIPLENRQWS